MQVSVEAGEGLERKLKIQIPTETVEAQVENRRFPPWEGATQDRQAALW